MVSLEKSQTERKAFLDPEGRNRTKPVDQDLASYARTQILASSSLPKGSKGRYGHRDSRMHIPFVYDVGKSQR